jgi:putative transposase
MAQHKDTTELTGLLFQWMGLADPMLGMLEWLCAQMMEAEVSNQLGAQKHEQSQERTSHR